MKRNKRNDHLQYTDALDFAYVKVPMCSTNMLLPVLIGRQIMIANLFMIVDALRTDGN